MHYKFEAIIYCECSRTLAAHKSIYHKSVIVQRNEQKKKKMKKMAQNQPIEQNDLFCEYRMEFSFSSAFVYFQAVN